MIKKALVLTSFAAGYVAGAHAGRERYEQIRTLALGIKNDPHVQDVATEAAGFARDQGAALVEQGAALVDKVTPDTAPDVTPDVATIDGTSSGNPVGAQREPNEDEILGPQGTSYSTDSLSRTPRS